MTIVNITLQYLKVIINIYCYDSIFTWFKFYFPFFGGMVMYEDEFYLPRLKLNHNIMNILVIFLQICYNKVFSTMNHPCDEPVSPVPWHFVNLRFHMYLAWKNEHVSQCSTLTFLQTSPRASGV